MKAGRGHRYKVEGLPGTLPSVTTICNVIDKPALVPWGRKDTAGRMGARLKAVEPDNLPGEDGYDEYVDELVKDATTDDTTARDLGTATHRLISEAITGYPEPIEDLGLSPEQIKLALHAAQAGLSLLDHERIEVCEVERPVWHPQLLYAGTIDLIGRRGNELIVLDWKRSKTLYRSNMAQVVAYAMALSATTDSVFGCAVVRLPQHVDDGADIRYTTLDDESAAMPAVRAAHSAYEATRAMKWGSRWS